MLFKCRDIEYISMRSKFSTNLQSGSAVCTKATGISTPENGIPIIPERSSGLPLALAEVIPETLDEFELVLFSVAG